MKNNLVLLLAAFCCAPLFAQNTTTWFVPGCQWRYEFISQVGPGEEVFKYVGEEMKGGELCMKLHWYGYNDGPLPPGPVDYGFQYFFARNDSVFAWNESFAEFRLLYDFTRQVGDTVLLNYSLYDKAAIIDVGNTTIQGIPVRYQDIRLIYSLNNPPLVTQTRVYERLGGQHLLYWDIESPLTEIYYSLDCYRDDEYPEMDCDLTISTAEPPLDELLRLYPNPTSGQVLLELPDDALPALLRLFDSQGKLLTTKEITAPQTPLDVSAWSASAVLFLQIQSADGRQAARVLRVNN